MKKLVYDPHINLELRIRLLKCYEYYAMQRNHGHLQSLPFRDVELQKGTNISWTDHVTNKQVLDHLNQERELLHTIKACKICYLEHLLRIQEYFLPQLIIQDKIEDKNSLGSETWDIGRVWTTKNWSE